MVKKFTRNIPFVCILTSLLAANGCQNDGRGDPVRGSQAGFSAAGSPVHDFGEHRQGEILTHTFELRNNFSVPVKILAVTSSCACLVPESSLKKTTVEPGGRFLLPVHFTTAGAAEAAGGRVMVTYVRLDDGNTESEAETVDLRVQASVLPDYRLVPDVVNFGTVDEFTDGPVTKVVTFIPEADPAVELNEVRSVPEHLDVRVLPSTSESAERTIEVTLDVSSFSGSRSLDTVLVVCTSSKRRPQALLRVWGRYQLPVEAVPDAVIIPSNEHGSVTRTVRLICRRPARILSAVCSDSRNVSAECVTGVVAKKHDIQVEVSESPDGPVRSELSVRVEVLHDSEQADAVDLRIPIHRFPERSNDVH